MDREFSQFLEMLKKRGSRAKDLEKILSLYETRHIISVSKKILRKRKIRGTKGKVEEFVESFYQNYYNSTGKLPSIKKVRELVGAYFGIPLTSKGLLPSHIERIVLRVRDRVRLRAWRQAKKNQSREGG